jgi:uncharacterized integral membrane protein
MSVLHDRWNAVIYRAGAILAAIIVWLRRS